MGLWLFVFWSVGLWLLGFWGVGLWLLGFGVFRTPGFFEGFTFWLLGFSVSCLKASGFGSGVVKGLGVYFGLGCCAFAFHLALSVL